MFLTLTLVTAFIGQPQTQARTSQTKAQQERAQLIAKRQNKRIARNTTYSAKRAQEAAWEAHQAREAERLFPLMVAQQQLYLENQRQWLNRQSELERNMILNRMAGAAERSSGYITPGNSPAYTPPSPSLAPHYFSR